MKKIVCLMLIFIALVMLSSCGEETSSDPSWRMIQEKGSIIIGVSEDNLPLTFRNSSGKMVGFDIEAATEVCRRLNLSVELMAIDQSDMQQKLDDKTIDCYWSGLVQSKQEVDDAYGTTAPYLRNDDIFLLPAGSDIKNIAHIAGKRLGVIAGSTGEEALSKATQIQSSLKLVEAYEESKDAFNALNTGKIDVVIMSETIAKYFMNLNPDRYEILLDDTGKEQEPFNRVDCVIAVRLDETALRKQLENALSSMEKDGKMLEIYERWFGSAGVTESSSEG